MGNIVHFILGPLHIIVQHCCNLVFVDKQINCLLQLNSHIGVEEEWGEEVFCNVAIDFAQLTGLESNGGYDGDKSQIKEPSNGPLQKNNGMLKQETYMLRSEK